MEWLNFVVVDPVKAMAIRIWGYVPVLVGALIILVVGWLLAKLIESLVVRVLKTLKLDILSDKAGIANVLAQGEINATLSEMIGAVIYWIVVLISAATALNAMNLTIAAQVISKLISYIPNILGAVFILVAGSFVANLVANIVKTSASNAGIRSAKLLAKVTQVILIIFTIAIAIEQLQIASALIVLAINVILISMGIGLALAFGLGCKDIAGKAMQDMINNLKK
jgi:hypothetical protein